MTRPQRKGYHGSWALDEKEARVMVTIRRNPDELVKGVLSPAGMAIRHSFRLDVTTYAWVKDYVRDQDTREEIKRLQEKIVETRALPIHKDELREIFKERIEQINAFRIQQLKDHLAEVQKRQEPLFTELILDNKKISGARMLPFFMNFSPTQIETIFSELLDGVSQKDIEKSVSELQKNILKLEDVLSKELNPKERWFYRDTGIAEPYPNGCRWSLFVNVWKRVLSRFEGEVDIEGYALNTPEEFEAFGLLKLDGVMKITPLTKPRQR
jgi:hypothetical protein